MRAATVAGSAGTDVCAPVGPGDTRCLSQYGRAAGASAGGGAGIVAAATSAGSVVVPVGEATYLFSGRITDENGAGAPNATVILDDSANPGQEAGRGASGPDGNFSFTVAPGTYIVRVSLFLDPGHDTIITSGEPLDLTSDLAQDITVPVPVQVTVSVTTATGGSLAGAQVTASGTPATWSLWAHDQGTD